MGDFDLARHFKEDWTVLRDYLTRKGASLPAGVPSRRIKILSPFRVENTPSFDLHQGSTGWRWTDWGDVGDHGGPANGTVIDLLLRHEAGIKTVSDALTLLCRRYGDPVPADRPGTPDDGAGRRKKTFQAVLKVSADQDTPLPSAGDEDNEVEDGIELGYVMNYANRGVTSTIGTRYLASRGLSSHIHGMLHDCCWSPLGDQSRRYYGVGLPNRAGDWNVRCGMRDKARSRLLVRVDRNRKERGGPAVLKVGGERTWDVVEGILSGMALVDAGFCRGALPVLNGTGNARRAALDILVRTAADNPDVAIRLHLDGDDRAVHANACLLDLVPTAQDYRPVYLAQRKGAGGDPLDFWASDPDGMRVALVARTAEIKNEVQERMVAA